ncbi:MAG: glycosyltransferase [Azospirillum sp.]|nr:glycosyltransferase [Azospirillum sp.]
MKKIGYVLGAVPALSDAVIAIEMKAMAAHGHEIVPILLGSGDSLIRTANLPYAQDAVAVDNIPLRDAAQVLAFPARKAAIGVRFALTQTGLQSEALLSNAARIAIVARNAGCGHLHAHFAWDTAAHAIVAAHLIGLTVSFCGHGLDIYGAPIDLVLKLRASDFAVAGCRDMADALLAQAPTARVGVVPFAVDPARFQPAPAGRLCNGRLLFIGRLIESEGLGDLLGALAGLRPGSRPSLDIVGDGPAGVRLRQRVLLEGLAAEVKFQGPQGWEWIAEHGRDYAALVAPLRPDGERDAGTIAVKEAMAMGLPVVASRANGVQEIVDTSCGFLVPPGDRKALAAALCRAVALTQDHRQRLGACGRAIILKAFTAERQASRLSDLIEAA